MIYTFLDTNQSLRQSSIIDNIIVVENVSLPIVHDTIKIGRKIFTVLSIKNSLHLNYSLHIDIERG